MRLAPGKRYGPYEIAGIIGVGGMGEVYRATDTNLKRDVAIKVLPESFVSDELRTARIQREAELLASLNHINVGQIYGIDRSDDTTALILELVEGPTLAERLEHGAILVDEALDIARQIAEALEAAHARGIIHRDLKPANIKLRPDGIVKVLDFGIARVNDRAVSPSGHDESTPAETLTEAGAIIGTAAYMSPEQARGQPVDERADIFAFGAVLFEMLTGQQPFLGQDATDTVAGVLKSDPDWNLLPDVPMVVKAFLKQCLEKNPSNRMHDIADVRLALAGKMDFPVAERPEASTNPRARILQAAGVVALIVIAASVGWLVAGMTDAPSRENDAMELYAVGPRLMESRSTSGSRYLDATPDGTRLTFESGPTLWLQTLGRQDAVPVASGSHAFFSPDGDRIAFLSRGALVQASVYDRIPITVASLTGGVRFVGGAWHDDTIVFATQRGVYRTLVNGGSAEPALILPAPPGAIYAWPEFIPDGSAVLLTAIEGSGIENASIRLLDLEALELSAPLVLGAVGARYVEPRSGPAGRLIYVTDEQGRLETRVFDPKTLTIAEVPEAVPDIEVLVEGSYFAASFDVTPDGDLVYAGARQPARNRLVWVDHAGTEETIDVALTGPAEYPRVSPDGNRIAFDVGFGTSRRRIWTMNLGRNIPERLSDSGDGWPVHEDLQALWSRDGTRIYFASTRTLDFRVWWHAADGSGSDIQLGDNPDFWVPVGLTPDDQLLIHRGPYATADVLVVDPADTSTVTSLIEAPFSVVTPSISADGRWIAFASNETGSRYEIFLQSYPSGEIRERVSRNGGANPMWSLDGSNELYYVGLSDSGEAAMMAVVPSSAGRLELRERELFRREFLGSYTQPSGLRQIDISPIDSRFLFALPQTPGNDPQQDLITLWYLRNWIEAH